MKRIVYLLYFMFLMSCAFEAPYFITIEAHGDGCRLKIDDKFADLLDISEAIYHNTKNLDSIQKSKFYVKLKFSNLTEMGLISDIKNELRRLEIRNVKYYTIEEEKCNQGF